MPKDKGSATAAKPSDLKKITLPVSGDLANRFRSTVAASGGKVGVVGEQLIRRFVEATDAERAKMLGVTTAPKPAKGKAAKSAQPA